MKVKALVVDDSVFFRARITEILAADPNIEVIGGAANGREAVDMVARLHPDVVTMDIEMPVMDGITAVRRIMSERPTPILMFSSSTHEGARATLDALDAGALDYLPKRFEDIARDRHVAAQQFRLRVRALARQRPKQPAAPQLPKPSAPAELTRSSGAAQPSLSRRAADPRLDGFRLVAIAASTGGPVALQSVLTRLPSDFPMPVIVVQHMPATFTTAFAERLNQICRVMVREAADGDVVQAGTVYIAAGGKQMLVHKHRGGTRIRICDGDPALHYKPCVDVTFKAIAGIFHGNVLAIVMTGMGSDGCEGARVLKRTGATVWAQDEASCIVYGMPMAVVNARIADRVMSLTDIGAILSRGV